MASYLYHASHRVSVVNPSRIKAFGQNARQRTKNGRSDAKLIAHFAVKHEPKAWTPPPAELRHLQALVRHRDDLMGQRSQWQQRLEESRPVPAVRPSLQALIAAVDTQLQQIEQEIHDHVEHDPDRKPRVAIVVVSMEALFTGIT